MTRTPPLFALVTIGFLIGTAGVEAQGPLMKRWMARQQGEQTKAPGAIDITYGNDSAQHLDFWRATRAGGARPLVIFVHGGGWKRGDMDNATGAAKVTHSLDQGYAFASIDYRLVPAATVEQQAQDVADAVAKLVKDAPRLGFDPRRMVLMGHSAGAHLAALVGTDTRYLENAGLRADALRGIVLLDGAAYDVPKQIAEGGRFMHDTYVQAFGSDPARQKALSPTFQVAAPNAPSFLILHIDRADGTAQSEALGAALRKAGAAVEVKGFEGTGLRGHMEINRSLGDPSYPATPVVDAYLTRTFG
jgi:acetyl esterase/lipase